ncbi:MFS transporter [Alloiococcus sp. CFN-8]|uniref:MFS transporter n=1 Tax=Alloiococcus sp. CFN-8 TaxID=3416081 RepID=UPI003CF98358
MDIKNKLRKNVLLSYIYSFLLGLDITSAIWVLYLAFKGMSLVQIGALEAIYHITSLLFELPTGAIADVYGKKLTVVLGRAASVVSCLLMISSSSFWGFALAFVISAAGMNLHSGAAEALSYDSLKALGEEGSYKRIWGKVNFLIGTAQGVALILGGILADIKFLYAYILGGLIQGAAFITALGFSEPPEGEVNERGTGNSLIYQVKTSIKVLRERKVVLYLILFSALVGSLQTTVFFYSQQFFSDMGYSKTAIAVICALGCFIEAVTSRYAYKIEKVLKLMGSLIIIALISVGSLVGLGFFRSYSIIFFLFISITGGVAYTIFSAYINERLPSEYRATILSFDGLCFSLFMIAVFPLFGVLAHKLDFHMTFGLLALLYIPVLVLLTIKINKYCKNSLGDVKNDRISFK